MEFFAGATAGAKKYTSYRPDDENNVGGFVHGFTPTIGGLKIQQPGWPEYFLDRDAAIRAAGEFKRVCKDYLKNGGGPCPIV